LRVAFQDPTETLVTQKAAEEQLKKLFEPEFNYPRLVEAHLREFSEQPQKGQQQATQ
jgi:hypothetical protein